MRNIFVWNTKIGPFYIAEANGRFHAVYKNQDLGSYAHPEQAAEDLANGHTFSIAGGINSVRLGIPEDVNEWERL